MLTEFFVLTHAEQLRKTAGRLSIQNILLVSSKMPLGRKLFASSALLMEIFDHTRTAQVLEKWRGLAPPAKRLLLDENGPILLPRYRTILENDLELTASKERSAA